MIPYVVEGTVEGNAEVVALFARWLERAKLGQLNFAAVSVTEGPIHVYHDFSGAAGMEFACNWGLDTLKQRIMHAANNRVPPEMDKTAPANQFIWLGNKAPACFDFFPWIVMCEMSRIREKAPAPLKIGFYWGPDGNMERILQTAGRRQMYTNVIKPALAFVGAVEDASCLENGRILERYTMTDIVRDCRLGHDIPLFVPSKEAVDAVRTIGQLGPYVTITLREAAYSAHRNSNKDEWLKFAEYLEAQGERVIFVRDTHFATEPLAGWGGATCPAASVDIDVRLALYEAAKANLFVANGPWSLALFGTAPWLMFVEVNAMDPYPPNTNQWWRQFHGIGEGEQMPWSRPDQRIVWQRDTFGNLSKAWEQLEPLLNLRQAAE